MAMVGHWQLTGDLWLKSIALVLSTFTTLHNIIHSSKNYCPCNFPYLIFFLNCIAGSDENYASHCSELSQLHQQPVDCPTFIWKLWYKPPSDATFIFIQTLIKILSSLLNGVMMTGSVRCNFQNLCYFRFPI